jgi:drug/metabolite transporter (DMT)-like permease
MFKKILSFGPIFVIIAALLWSLDGLLRVSLYSLPPAVIVFYEHSLGALILVLLSSKWIKDLRSLGRKEWSAITIVSLFSGALGTMFYTAALGMINFTQFSVVVLLQQLQPIWAIGAAAILLKEKIRKRFIFWAALSLVAAFFITFKDLSINLSTGAGTATAGILALSAGFMWGTSTAVSKIALKKISFLTATALRFIITPVFALIIIAGQSKTDALFSLNLAQWQTLLLITLSTGMVALAIYYYGLKKTPARVATLCELSWPASAIFIDYFRFGNTLSITQIMGVALLALCIYKVTRKNELKT